VAERELVVVGDQHPVDRRAVRGGQSGRRGWAPDGPASVVSKRLQERGGGASSPVAW
jgi:hypothetical protein